jgi:23S rRNA (cytidine1920-2'-O)/16S rRNA (cytidine1409-2'-O)-methyltransferase
MGGEESAPYVSRAGAKLEAALAGFGVDVTGLVCADFGCHVGGFTDCLLRHGAAKVYALDTGYGVLDYRLRTDPRVVVMERTNVLHCDPPAEAVDLVTIDLGWTRQHHALPAALRWLDPGGRVITLVKPHYELDDDRKRTLLKDGVLEPEDARRILAEILAAVPRLGAEVEASMPSPIAGAKSARRRGGRGNREYLVLAAKMRPTSRQPE